MDAPIMLADEPNSRRESAGFAAWPAWAAVAIAVGLVFFAHAGWGWRGVRSVGSN